MKIPSSACPGCGVVLPVNDWPIDRRVNASPACWRLYDTVRAHELIHVTRLGRLHQFSVDAYAAQHAGPNVPPIGIAFALLGLHLALDLGWNGNAVRAAHQHLAQRLHAWPRFEPPSAPAWLTIAHVVGSPTPDEHARRTEAWAASVWKGWSAEHDRVRDWTDDALPVDARSRLRLA